MHRTSKARFGTVNSMAEIGAPVPLNRDRRWSVAVIIRSTDTSRHVTRAGPTLVSHQECGPALSSAALLPRRPACSALHHHQDHILILITVVPTKAPDMETMRRSARGGRTDRCPTDFAFFFSLFTRHLFVAGIVLYTPRPDVPAAFSLLTWRNQSPSVREQLVAAVPRHKSNRKNASPAKENKKPTGLW